MNDVVLLAVALIAFLASTAFIGSLFGRGIHAADVSAGLVDGFHGEGQ